MRNILEAKIGFGTYQIKDQNIMNNVIKWAIQYNYDFIDTAKVYGNEHMVGSAIVKLKKEDSNFKMPLIQSKIWTADFKNGVEVELKKSLERLQMDSIDSYLLHRPHVDNTVNVQVWKELIECKKKGLVRTIGVSNFEPDMIRILYNETKVMPELVQNEASVNYMRHDRMVYCEENNINMQGWRAIGKIEENLKNPILLEIAKKYNCSISHLLIAFINSWGFVPIIKSEKEERIKDNIKALPIKIDREDLFTIENHCNKHKATTSEENDSYAFLYLDK